ncbi:MAG: ABA4-like family protein [Pseudomonadota bacterium]
MAPEDLFGAANMLALAGWVALLASPLVPVWSQRIAGAAIPLLLAIAYAGIGLAFFAGADGGFGDLAGVMSLFDDPWVTLGGWIHFLAFDLFVGAWIVRRAREEEVAFLLVVPCLALTFMFGPAGFLAFSAIRLARGGFRSVFP